MLIKLILSIIICLVISCGTFKGKKEIKLAESFKTNEKHIVIDSTTSHYNYSIQLSTINNLEILSIFNNNTFSIDIYNWATGKQVQRIKLAKEGPNKIQYSGIEGHHIHTNDSIWVFCPDILTFNLINKEGSVIKRIDLQKFKLFGNQENAYPKISTFAPLIKINKTHYILTAEAGSIPKVPRYSTLNTIFKVNLNDSFKIDEFIKYPSIYDEGNWGDYLPYLVYSTLNTSKKLLLTSFGRDDSILVYDLNKHTSIKKYGGSYLFSNKDIKKLSEKCNEEFKDRSIQQIFDFTTPMYFGIYYDSLNNLIYRIVRNKPPTSEEIKINGGDFRKNQGYAILVFDEIFNKLGEFQLENDRYNIESIFCIHGKLYILLNARSQLQEDLLTFDEFDFSKLKNTEH